MAERQYGALGPEKEDAGTAASMTRMPPPAYGPVQCHDVLCVFSI